MAKTNFGGSNRIRSLSLGKETLKADFLEGANLDLTNGNNNATITGLSDGVNPRDAVTKAQLDLVIASQTGNLTITGSLDASTLGAQLDNVSKGNWFKVTVAGTIFGTNPIELAIGDNLYVQNDVTGTPTDGVDFFKIDNTESPDILKYSNIVNDLLHTAADNGVLDARQGKILKDAQDILAQKVADMNTLSGVAANATNLGTFTGATVSDNGTIKSAIQELETAVEAAGNPNEEFGEQLVVSNGSAVLPALANTPTVIMGVYLNGFRMNVGSGNDYTITGGVITFEYNLENIGINVDVVLVDYKY